MKTLETKIFSIPWLKIKTQKVQRDPVMPPRVGLLCLEKACAVKDLSGISKPCQRRIKLRKLHLFEEFMYVCSNYQ